MQPWTLLNRLQQLTLPRPQREAEQPPVVARRDQADLHSPPP